jgi:hypothetical protein
MLLSLQQINGVFAKHGGYAKECCDRCGQLLGPVRFTRRGDVKVRYSPDCRGDGYRRAIRRGGRPRKVQNQARAFQSTLRSVQN